MSKYRQGILYVRRLKSSDKCESWADALRLAVDKMIAEKRGGHVYVLVRHGQFRDGRQPIMSSGTSKRGVLASFYITGTRGMSQRQRLRTWRDSPKARPTRRKSTLAAAVGEP